MLYIDPITWRHKKLVMPIWRSDSQLHSVQSDNEWRRPFVWVPKWVQLMTPLMSDHGQTVTAHNLKTMVSQYDSNKNSSLMFDLSEYSHIPLPAYCIIHNWKEINNLKAYFASFCLYQSGRKKMQNQETNLFE